MADELKSDLFDKAEKRGSPDGSGINKRYVDVTAMIRSLQRIEGVNDCFKRGDAECDRHECSWRKYCLGSPDDASHE